MAATTPETDLSDDELAARIARRGETAQALRAAREACEQLYGRHARLLSAFLAARVRRGEVDDLHQEIWRRVWHRLPDQFQGGNFRAWLHEIARNALIDQGRRKRAEPLETQEALPDHRDDRPEARLIERERMEVLRRCLDRLGAEAATLVRARLGGEDYPEICLRLGMKPERAHKLFHRAKEQLQTCVERALA